MINLAGKADCDVTIRRELERCQIEAVDGARSAREVPASVTGKLGPFVFRRAWYYWIVGGPVPLHVAWELYDDPVGRTDVRVDGHCGCPKPEWPWVRRYDAQWRLLQIDKSGEEELRYRRYVDAGFIARRNLETIVFCRYWSDIVRATDRAVVECYHIDSEIGLRLFADTIKRHGLDKK